MKTFKQFLKEDKYLINAFLKDLKDFKSKFDKKSKMVGNNRSEEEKLIDQYEEQLEEFEAAFEEIYSDISDKTVAANYKKEKEKILK